MVTGARRAPLVVLLATLAAVALTARLGAWQLSRASQKEALQATLAAGAGLPPLPPGELARDAPRAEAQRDRRVRLHGRWLPEHTVYLDNRPMDGRVGFYVVTPLLLAAPADAVLVQRGWLPRNWTDRSALPPSNLPPGEVDVDGIIAPPPARLYEFDDSAVGPIRQNLDPQRFAADTGLALRPLSVQQTASADTAGDGLTRHWPRPAVDIQKHYGYAFQWFALAALMTGLYVWFQLVRPRLARRA